MQAEIEISIDFEAWTQEDEGLIPLLGQAAQNAFQAAEKPAEMENLQPEISLLLSNNEIVQQLNSQYRDKDTPTNVLSFPQYDMADLPHEPPLLMGDVILAYETVKREAEEKNIPLLNHAAHLVVHGVLHLLGYDHSADQQAEHMERLEVHILKELGYDNPYES